MLSNSNSFQKHTTFLEASSTRKPQTFLNFQNSISGGITINQSKEPYVEMLRLVQAFLKIKGEMAGRLWALLNDNAHIVAALRDTLVAKLSTLHTFTLSFITVLRKILEFAVPLFSNISAGFAFG